MRKFLFTLILLAFSMPVYAIDFKPDGYINFGVDGIITLQYQPPIGSPPIAGFYGTPTTGTDPLSVNFTDISSNTPTTWLWSFGDSTSTTTQNPTHVYTATGVYTVSLFVSNMFGSDIATKTNYITVMASITNDIWLNATMTSNTEPAPFEVKGAFPDKWKVFDHDLYTLCECNSISGAIGYDFGDGNASTAHLIKVKNVSNYGAKTFYFFGSDNYTDFTELASGTLSNDETLQEINFSNSTAYRYYKFQWDDSYDSSLTKIYEIEIWGTP